MLSGLCSTDLRHVLRARAQRSWAQFGTCRRVGTWDLKRVERDGNERELGGGRRRGEVGGERVDGVLETANGDRVCVNAKEETSARGLPTNWVVAAGRAGCCGSNQNLQAGIKSKGSHSEHKCTSDT